MAVTDVPPPAEGSAPEKGVAKRAARAALRRVDAMFSAKGPAFKQLGTSWAGNVAGDTLVAIALAGTLFFDVPTTEARDRVALRGVFAVLRARLALAQEGAGMRAPDQEGSWAERDTLEAAELEFDEIKIAVYHS